MRGTKKEHNNDKEKEHTSNKEKEHNNNKENFFSHGILGKFTSFFNSIYARVPILPFFDRPTSALLLFCIAVFVLVFAFVFLTVPGSQSHVREAPLLKNAALSLAVGEQYAYEMSLDGTKQTVYYSVKKTSSCLGTFILENDLDQTQALCLSATGNPIGDETQSNSTLGNSSMLLFSPWMLAVSDNFNWKVEQIFSAGTAEFSIPTYFSSLGRKKIAGRDAYKIEIQSDVAAPGSNIMYIDSQKRILLSANIQNITVKLVRAPFALDWNVTNTNSSK